MLSKWAIKSVMKWSKTFKNYWLEIILATASLAFSWWLMWHTFDYQEGIIYIASKAWSDFAAHIPLIRSFSWGNNFPPEYPLFPGQPIKYHFLFYMIAGFLERTGLSLDWALNLPSTLGFWLLLITIFWLSQFIFRNKLTALLSVIFFLFNSSLSFVYFFRKNDLFSPKIFAEIASNQIFPAFAPYDGSLISGGFWNLNVFTNQRHFAPALAICLGTILFILTRIKKNRLNLNQALACGFILGILPLAHTGVFLMSLTLLGMIWLIFKQRKILASLLVTGLLSLPQVYYLKSGSQSLGLQFRPGYLMINNLNLFTFTRYWLLNLGLSTFLIPLGFFLSNRFAKKIFLCFLPIFIIGNLFQFGPDIAVNHKFFNLWIIVANMFSAYALSWLFRKKIWGKLLVILLIIPMTLSGIIDFFAIKNDPIYSIADAPINQDVLWIKNNTPPDAIFLNSSYIFHPASLAGRKIFLGWPYFSWSIGYDTQRRDAERKKILEATLGNKKLICNLLNKNQIDYVCLEESAQEISANKDFWENNFSAVYQNKKTGFLIYDVKYSCNDE